MNSSLSSSSPLRYCVFKGKELCYKLPPNQCLLTHFRSQDKDLTVLPMQEASSTAENKVQGTFKAGSSTFPPPSPPLNKGPAQ